MKRPRAPSIGRQCGGGEAIGRCCRAGQRAGHQQGGFRWGGYIYHGRVRRSRCRRGSGLEFYGCHRKTCRSGITQSERKCSRDQSGHQGRQGGKNMEFSALVVWRFFGARGWIRCGKAKKCLGDSQGMKRRRNLRRVHLLDNTIPHQVLASLALAWLCLKPDRTGRA